jgi:hypothetical protein
MRKVGVADRRAMIARRHFLAPGARAGNPLAVAEALVALHGTDPASVFLSVLARMRRPDIEAIERAMYEDRVLLRMLGMRRTVFTVPVELAPIIQAACTRDIAAKQRRLLLGFLAEDGVGDAAWLADVERSTLAALAARGTATAAELSADEPRLREQIVLAKGKSYGGPVNISSRVLFLMAADGRIVRGRPRGSWISSQFHWSTVEAWLPRGLAEPPVETARAELARRWLAAFGPGTVADLKWWTGWTAGQTKAALAALSPVEVDLDGTTGLMLPPGDADTAADTAAGDADGPDAYATGAYATGAYATEEPRAVLLPALDPTVMGWRERGWFLGEHGQVLFDRNGNAGPTVWWEGRIVGGWAQRKDGEIVFRLLEDVGTEAAEAVSGEARRLAALIGDVRVTPRFRTPLERELTG